MTKKFVREGVQELGTNVVERQKIDYHGKSEYIDTLEKSLVVSIA